MTTQVIVKACSGWAVRVSPLSIRGALVGVPVEVAAGAEQSFHVHYGQDLLVHEIQPGEAEPGEPADPMLRHFAWAHLPVHLRDVSMPFGMLARRVTDLLPAGAERTVCLRKLLEAKDCAVRALAVDAEAR